MFKEDAQQAIPIVDATLEAILAATPTRGRKGANLRTLANAIRVNAEALLMAGTYAPPLRSCFEQATDIGISFPAMEYVRQVAAAGVADLAGAIFIRDVLVLMALAAEGNIIAGMVFASRDDVEAIRLTVNQVYAPAEENIANAYDATGYLRVLNVHAAISNYLTKTAQPLPMMLNYEFATGYPSYVISHKLYADASRADELRNQNHVIHPAFMPLTGRALSR